jgi:hypothetical protein
VKRFINGEWVKYVEMLHSRQFTSVEDAWFVDSGLELGLTYPAGDLYPEAAEGSAVTFAVTGGSFAVGDIGKVIRVNGGVATIVSRTDATHVVANITVPLTEVLPYDGTPLGALSGAWSMTTPVSTVSGLDHLEGQSVAILGDGNVFPQQVVNGGRITLNHACSRIIVGLPYEADFQSLRLDTGEPTIQGKRKKIPAVTMRVEKSRGLSVGTTFGTLTEIKERTTQPYGQPIQPITGDERITLDPSWNPDGQVCARQSNPLPSTILGIIPEIVVGDT